MHGVSKPRRFTELLSEAKSEYICKAFVYSKRIHSFERNKTFEVFIVILKTIYKNNVNLNDLI